MSESGKLLVLYLCFFTCTAVFSFLINGLFLRFSKTLGIRNVKDTVIRWGSQSKPAFGGISFYIIYLFSAVFYLLFFEQGRILNIQFLGLTGAVTLGFLMGLADDAYNTKPLLKFLAQFTCGTILVATGTVINLFESETLNAFLTVFWIVGIMNSINMLDNMDAITTLVSIFILLSTLVALALQGDFIHVNFLIALGGIAALLGFLYFNWNPSKMYMGDTGSQFLGVVIGAMGVEYFFNSFTTTQGNEFSAITLVLVVFLLPIVDTTTVTINRIARGQSPFVGGKDHTTHHLSYFGFSDKQVAIAFASIGIINTIIAFYILKGSNISSSFKLIIPLVYVFGISSILFFLTKYKKKI